MEDAIACAKIFLKLREEGEEEILPLLKGEESEFKGIVVGILADDEVNYKEAYKLLYWLEDHPEMAEKYQSTFLKTKAVLEDAHLDKFEAIEIKIMLDNILKTL